MLRAAQMPSPPAPDAHYSLVVEARQKIRRCIDTAVIDDNELPIRIGLTRHRCNCAFQTFASIAGRSVRRRSMAYWIRVACLIHSMKVKTSKHRPCSPACCSSSCRRRSNGDLEASSDFSAKAPRRKRRVRRGFFMLGPVAWSQLGAHYHWFSIFVDVSSAHHRRLAIVRRTQTVLRRLKTRSPEFVRVSPLSDRLPGHR